MKLVQLSKHAWGRNSITAGMLLSFLFLTACNSERPDLASATPQGDMVHPCNPADSVDFPLDANTIENGNQDVVTDLETGPYDLADCMCEIDGLLYIFQGVGQDCQILVIDADGNTLDSMEAEVTIENGIATILLPHPEELPDDRLTVSFAFDTGGDDPKPTLIHAGGLCIIENVVGTIAGTTEMQEPFVLEKTDVNGNTIKKIYIPAAIGGMPY